RRASRPRPGGHTRPRTAAAAGPRRSGRSRPADPPATRSCPTRRPSRGPPTTRRGQPDGVASALRPGELLLLARRLVHLRLLHLLLEVRELGRRPAGGLLAALRHVTLGSGVSRTLFLRPIGRLLRTTTPEHVPASDPLTPPP